MKRNLILLLILLGLSIAAYFIFFKSENGLSNESDIHIKDTADVSRIFMTDMQGRKIDLKRTKEGWILNEKITPRIDAIHNLLNTLQYQFATQPVPYTAHNNVVKDLTANATKVEVYNLNSKKVLCFFVGGENTSVNTTCMMKEGAKRPYFYKLPGLDGFLNSRYFMSTDEWRSRSVINLKSTDIKKVELQYHLFPENNFWIAQDNGVITSSIPNYNTSKANDYLHFFEHINCIGYENSVTTADSMNHYLDKMCTLIITDKNNQIKTLLLYYVNPNKRTKAVVKVKNKEYDLNLLYGFDGKNIMTFNTEYIKKLLLLSKDFEG